MTHETPPAVLARLDALEQEWRRRVHAIGRDVGSYTQCADELATLRASLAQQGEAVATFTVTNCGPCPPDLDMEWLSDYRTFAGKGPQLLFTHPAAVDEAMVRRAQDAYCQHQFDANPKFGPPSGLLRPGDEPMRAALAAALRADVSAFLAANGGSNDR